MRINFELLDIRAFLAVLQEGTFHRAAEVLHISQPALSRRIKSLEDAIGAPLLHRTTRRVAPTAVGHKLRPMFMGLIDDVEGSVLSMRETGNRQSGLVTIACVPTAAFYFLPRVIRLFNEQYPLIRFRILDLPASEGLQSVSEGQTEFGINMLGSSDSDLRFTHLADDSFVLACRRDHALAYGPPLRWSDLRGFPLIGVSHNSGNRTILDSALAQAGPQLDWFYEFNHVSTSLGLVEAGLGVAVLPKLATPQADHPLIVTRKIVDPLVVRPIGLVERRAGRLSPAAARFRQMLVDNWKDGRHENILT
jgi:DNA-binding transcriptional LysR family regulator